MNIVYAVKIFAALIIMLGALRVICGRGLRQVMTEADWRACWKVAVGTLLVSCFSVSVPLFFVTFSLWAMFAPQMFGKDGDGRLPAYVFLACISPQFTMQLKDLGPLRDIMPLNAIRIAEIFILVPETLRLLARSHKPVRPGWLLACDVATFGYFAYWIIHLFGSLAASALVRETIPLVLDTLLPYYVVSRACVGEKMRRRVMSIALFGATYQAIVALAETLSHHLLYAQLQYLYNVRFNIIGALTRGAFIRAQAAFSGPLVLAVLLVFGLGLWFALRPRERSRAYLLPALVLVGGLLSTFSRGPLLAVFILGAAMLLLRFMSARRFLMLAVLVTIVASAAWSYGLGDAVVALVNSFSGEDKTADFNVLYRQELLRMSIALIKQSPWWGVPNYMQQLESLRQGEGIIDLVNTYLVVTLNVGVFGLLLFLLPYAVALWKHTATHESQSFALRREALAWIPLTLAVLAVVFTVSPVSIIRPVLIWTLALALARLQDGAPVRRHALAPIAAAERADG